MVSWQGNLLDPSSKWLDRSYLVDWYVILTDYLSRINKHGLQDNSHSLLDFVYDS